MKTVISSGWWNLSYTTKDRPNRPDYPHDGHKVVAWADCAWRPDAKPAEQVRPVEAETVRVIKKTLQVLSTGDHKDGLTIIGGRTLAYIEYLEQKRPAR